MEATIVERDVFGLIRASLEDSTTLTNVYDVPFYELSLIRNPVADNLVDGAGTIG